MDNSGSSAIIAEKLVQIQETLKKEGTLDYLIPFFFMLQVEGRVFSLEDHFQFEPMFRLQRPKKLCLMCARQVGKSFSISAKDLLLSWLIPGYRSLFVLPRYEQAKRLSNDCMKLLINTSPYKDLYVDSSCDQTALYRSFNNNSVQYFQYAFLDPDRVRGISAIGDVYLDECVSGSTIIGYDSPVRIDEIGDSLFLESFTKDGYIIPSVTTGASKYMGIRNCFRITLEDNKTIDATIGHKFPTNRGWKTTEDIINHIHNAGISTAVQLQALPDITEVHEVQSLLIKEQQLKYKLEGMPDLCSATKLCLYVHPPLVGKDQSLTPTSLKANLSRIVKIEYIGPQEVYDLSVVGTNTFFANGIAVHNCQDMNWDFIPVIEEVSSAVKKWGFKNYTGTPKTLDNTLTTLFEDSSQAEWVTKCPHCNKFNIPAIEHDLIKMIGKETCVCAKCGLPLDCSQGTYVHRFPNLRREFSGYHISQVTHPLHYKIPEKWLDLTYKHKTWDQSKFYNEILGVPCDSAEKLINQAELRAVCSPNEDEINSLRRATLLRNDFVFRAIGIDWGGGGEESQSFTAIVLGGIRAGQENVEVLYATKLKRSMPSWDQAQFIVELVKKFSPNFIAHDYGGAGVDKETILIQAGLPIDKIIPFTYVVSPNKPIISYNRVQKGYRDSYSLDKMRSIVVLAHMLKARKVSFPTWESMTNVDTGSEQITLLEDFLYINAERIERPRGGDIIQITKTPRKSDDFVHALNYLCSCIWYSLQRYPNIAEAANMQLTAEDVASLNPISPIQR